MATSDLLWLDSDILLDWLGGRQPEKALATLGTLSQLGMIADLTAAHVRKALTSAHRDFEDELQIACAVSLPGLTAIITRNLTDYAHSPVPAMTASDWLAVHPLP